MRFEYLCPRCHRQLLFFWRPATVPACRHGRRWSLFGTSMIKI